MNNYSGKMQVVHILCNLRIIHDKRTKCIMRIAILHSVWLLLITNYNQEVLKQNIGF